MNIILRHIYKLPSEWEHLWLESSLKFGGGEGAIQRGRKEHPS